eukprot:2213563-Prorocentrum_lima.AAC.1
MTYNRTKSTSLCSQVLSRTLKQNARWVSTCTNPISKTSDVGGITLDDSPEDDALHKGDKHPTEYQ